MVPHGTFLLTSYNRLFIVRINLKKTKKLNVLDRRKKNSLKRISILEWKEFWLWLKEFLGCKKFFIGFLEEVTRFFLSEGKLNESNSSITISNNAMSVKNFTVTAKWEIWGKL